MTGQLIYVDKKTRLAGGHKLNEGDFVQAVGGELPNRFTRVVIEFKDKSKLFFNDMRKFGYLKIVDETELSRLLNNNYGIEPLTDDYTWNNFKDIFKNRRTSVKALLLNQKVIAGLGNIYVDEALFLSGVRPNRKTNSLKEVEKKILFRMIRQVIKRAIDYRGTTFKDYTDSEGKKGNFSKLLKVYGREGEECCKCKRGIKKIRLAGRGTHYCSYCQK